MAWRDAATVAPNCSVINKAISGTITSYWIENLADALADTLPDRVLFYCGSNDINGSVTEEQIAKNISHCFNIIHDLLPNISAAYFSIIKAPQKDGKWELINRLNDTVKASLPVGDLYVETNDVFFDGNKPVDKFFIDDGLHLTDNAYMSLSDYARPLISNWMTE